jgi:hypothetical protein
MSESNGPDRSPAMREEVGMEALFHTSEPQRGAYLSRLFAFFSEDVVRHWSACEEAPYRDIGRPVLWDEDGPRFHVLDFALQRRSDGALFVAEMKCEIEFEGYRYLTLSDPAQVEHHVGKAAFQKFLRIAHDPKSLRVTIGGKALEIDGAILVWGALTDDGRAATMNHHRLADVLSVQDMMADLAEWQPREWADWVRTRERWTHELFAWLAYP